MTELYNKFKPMLAERRSVHEWMDKVRFPVIASPKLDGIRCVVLEGQAVARSLKPIPNRAIREALESMPGPGWPLDGELVAGEGMSENTYHRTVSAVMTKEHPPTEHVTYWVFDVVERLKIFEKRDLELAAFLEEPLAKKLTESCTLTVKRLKHVKLYNVAELEQFEALCLEQGYEGVVLRSPSGGYKFGRATAKDQWLMKLKRFVDDEAIITGFEELMRNDNESFKNELGNTARSSVREGLVAGNTLGALVVENRLGSFRIGMFKGLTSADKESIWNNRDSYLGKVVKFSYFPVGVKDLPRHAKFIGFRDSVDL